MHQQLSKFSSPIPTTGRKFSLHASLRSNEYRRKRRMPLEYLTWSQASWTSFEPPAAIILLAFAICGGLLTGVDQD
ncbi:hypothetical protein Tco_0281984 [Tanacetum coccineum]